MITKLFPFLLLLSLGAATQSSAQPVRIECSDTTLPLAERLVAIYAKAHPDWKSQASANPTAQVFANLSNKKADVAIAARSMRYKEMQACEAGLGERPTEYKAAVNGIAVYVNATNEIKELTYDDLAAIYRGKFNTWKDLGGQDSPIVALGLGTNTPPGELFAEEVLNGKDCSPQVRVVQPGEILKTVASHANAIGFASFVPAPEGARAVSIKRAFSSTPVDPSSESISNRIYPISRFVFCYLSPAGNQDSGKAFLEWIRSDEGQTIVQEAGFFPLGPKWRASK